MFDIHHKYLHICTFLRCTKCCSVVMSVNKQVLLNEMLNYTSQ